MKLNLKSSGTLFKQTFILLLSLLFSTALLSQTVTVKGKLISASDKVGLSYATISVAREATPAKAVKLLATEENGTFSTTLDIGQYVFTFNFVGMNKVEVSVTLTSSENQFDMGTIELTDNPTEFDEISVTAQAPLIKVEIDKLIYNAKDDPEASTSNVLDLLRKVPLVTVDGEENIQLKGASNFKIYINGKPSNMITSNPAQVLKSMPANSVKNIEVITDPGAKYDAEGIGGIINIVMDKRADDGYSGSVGANADVLVGGYGGNAYLATKLGKFGFTGNAGYYNFKRPASESTFLREETNPNNTLELTGTNENDGDMLNFSGALSFEPDTINLFNLSVSRIAGNYNTLSIQDAVSQGTRPPYTYSTRNNSIGQFGGMNLAADYQRNFKRKGEMLTVSYRYEHNPNDSEYGSEYDNVTGDFYLSGRKLENGYKLKSVNNAGGNEHTGQIDYVNPFNQKHNIEAGLKYIFRDNASIGDHTSFDVANNTWKPDLNKKNDLDHTQNITSGYVGYGYKTGKFGVKLGLRGEQTQQEIHFMSISQDTIINTSFFDLVPSVAISYQLAMTSTLRGGYNMRVSRPGIWYLNPYINDSDPNNITYGNPQLEAEQQHNFNLNYGSFTQKLNYNVSLGYSFAQNAVTNYSFIRDGVTHNTYDNIGRNHTVGTNLYASWTPIAAIRTYLNGGVNYTDIQSTENSELHNSGFSGRAFGGFTYSFPNDLRLGGNGGLFMNRVQLQTTQSAFYFYSFSVTKNFLDKKLDVSVNAQNIFSKYNEFSSTTTGEGFTQKSSFLNPMRNIRLNVTYRFGDLKTSMKKVQRTITNEDVMQKQSSSQGEAQ